MKICSSSDSEPPTRPKADNTTAEAKQQFDSPSGITMWPYYDLARCEAHYVVKNAVRIADTIFQAGFLPRAKSYCPVSPKIAKPWPLCEPKSHALDPPFHIKPTPGTDAFIYVPPKPFKERVLIPASTEVAKNPLSLSGGSNHPESTCAPCRLNNGNAVKSPHASNQS
ncbi:hypothetical protein ECG_07834 [Echinococcus granulosus]|uniref:Uncharacterized protein n=1 Tax=Echinococcus granulosus TaxID=6210 RepID=U6JDZ2_ECHGR|nr:hypothetical protein EGR_10504 [Echinococcus granulosus]EUB54631.1 hypothetical protein EGR_10504 [Echinococcus granulosus]KAH9279622.1 hypothetical protein ECG_07842 [Echinococcus granulosus]KAH9279878.1 hypothetical protein ECG_07834 [Echinococcus granulosus]CDS22266.1 hypothetical protein EgrG_000349000 [Echinococcus granulosus]